VSIPDFDMAINGHRPGVARSIAHLCRFDPGLVVRREGAPFNGFGALASHDLAAPMLVPSDALSPQDGSLIAPERREPRNPSKEQPGPPTRHTVGRSIPVHCQGASG
jgi:hypothetical protein